MIPRVLLTGGARSGKSRAAERRVGSGPATYVATGPVGADDPEWAARVAAHQATRPAAWRTLETTELLAPIRAASTETPVLVDCLTLWLTARLDHHGAWQDPTRAEAAVTTEIDALAAAVRSCPGGLVLVTNEVGSGIVPAERGARLFRDLLGVCNATVAAECDEVYLVAAGHVLPLRTGAP